MSFSGKVKEELAGQLQSGQALSGGRNGGTALRLRPCGKNVGWKQKTMDPDRK